MSQCLRMTPEEYAVRSQRAVRGVSLPGEKVPSVAKYKNVKTDGYASKREAVQAETLALLAKGGWITELVEQPKFLLIPAQEGMRPTYYQADFSYLDSDGVLHVCDAKGVLTEVFRIKRKLMKFVHGITVELL